MLAFASQGVVSVWATARGVPLSPTNLFAPSSTPAEAIHELALFILLVAAAIFVVVFGLLVYAIVRFRRRADDDGASRRRSTAARQLELAWTIIPILIVVVLFLSTARVIFQRSQQRAPTANALEVTVVGHQFWWEYRYPGLGVVTANELHVPVSDPAQPTPTLLELYSADTVHSFWVPRLAGKTDLIPNRAERDVDRPAASRASTSASARSTAAPSTPRCCSASTWTRPEDFEQWVAGAGQRPASRERSAVARGQARSSSAPRA